MQEHKIRQEIYHRLNKEHSDDLRDKEIVISQNIVEDAIRYFKETDIGWIYPSKSYMVAICYSKWLSIYFGREYMDYLNDEDLLYGNDPYFLPFEKDSKTYIKILNEISWNFDETKGMVPDVKQYFLKEFMIGEQC
jgi:hypothetical protein